MFAKVLLLCLVPSFLCKNDTAEKSNVSAPSSYIMNGLPADHGQFPYQVSIQHRDTFVHICGGSIIHEQWILTAAHCIDGMVTSHYYIYAGSIDRLRNGINYKIASKQIHPFFNRQNFLNDIGLLRTEKVIEFTGFVNKIDVENEYIGIVEDCTISGWGQSDPTSQLPRYLAYLSGLETMDTNDCAQMIENSPISPWYKNTQICTKVMYGHTTLPGDSGGALVYQERVIGVCSWSVTIEEHTYVNGYERISCHKDWLNRVIKWKTFLKSNYEEPQNDEICC